MPIGPGVNVRTYSCLCIRGIQSCALTQEDDETVETQGSDGPKTTESAGPLRLIRVHPPPVISLASLSEREKIVIGGAKGKEADLAVDDERVSRNHAVLGYRADGWEVTDLASRNGTKLDGGRLEPNLPAPLAGGSVLRFGNTVLIARRGEEPPDPEDSWHELLRGRAPGVAAARRLLRSLAKETGPVLILGETGTGKEYAARALAAAGRPFVPVNCAELTASLARAELFGSERGAFTDAAARPGLIALANGGVLFLDELGDLELGVQGELLRFLEDGQYRRVGGNELSRSTARVVAATNVDLDTAVRTGRFRRDLLGRLRRASHPVVLPPLRERREDILDWARRFLRDAGIEPELSAGCAEALLLHEWLENLRELSGVVRSAAREAQGGLIRREHLSMILDESSGTASSAAIVGTESASGELDREALEALLSEAGGTVREVALKTGIERTRLYRLIKKYGIDLAKYRPD